MKIIIIAWIVFVVLITNACTSIKEMRSDISLRKDCNINRINYNCGTLNKIVQIEILTEELGSEEEVIYERSCGLGVSLDTADNRMYYFTKDLKCVGELSFHEYAHLEEKYSMHSDTPNVDMLLFMGTMDLKKEKYNEAKEKFDEALSKNDKNRRAYFYRGQYYYEIGEYEKAYQDFKKAKDLFMEGEELYFYLKKLKRYGDE